MEALARAYDGKIPKYKSSVSGFECNLSGLENKAPELYDNASVKYLVSAYVLGAVGDAIEALTEEASIKYPSLPIIYSGGVMSCSLIRERLEGRDRYFSDPAFSVDNAAGIAYLTRYSHSLSASED